MRSVARYAASPAAPPKPPLRTGTGCATGFAVRPGSDSVTARSWRRARPSARRLASVVPPRIRMRGMSRPDVIAGQTAAAARWLSIVGIGEDGIDGLSALARGLVAGAEIVFGGKRHLG